MLSWFGIEASQAAQYVIAFVIILILAALLGLVLRRLTGGRLMLPGQDRGRARQPRLGIVDIYDLDRQRQLILLRRDNVEHLLLIGGPNDVVIETNIVRVAGARLPAAQNEPALDRPEPAFDNRVTEFPPRPQVEPAGRPSLESQIAARLNDLVARPSERSDSDQELAAIGTITSPSSARVEPPLKPNSVSVSPGPRPGRSEPAAPPPRLGQVPPVEPPAPRPEARPTPPPLRPVPAPRPMTTPEPPRMPAARPGPSTVGPSSLGPATRGPSTPAPGPALSSGHAPAVDAPSGEGRAPDAAILSDMAKQLEQALKRSPSAGEPPHHPVAARSPMDEPRLQAGRDDRYQDERAPRPAPPPPARGATIHDAPPSVAPVGQGARPPLEPVRPEPTRLGAVRPEPQRADPPRAPEPMRPESQRPSPPPEATRTEPPRPAPPQPAPPATPPQPAPPTAAPAPQKRTVDDPFSVEEIEAEFARLLGRPVDKTDNS